MPDPSTDPVLAAQEHERNVSPFVAETEADATDLEAGQSMVGALDPYKPSSIQREMDSRREPGTLEDLYHMHPQIGNSDWKVRVERISPRMFNGRIVAGALGDFYERLSIEQFKEKYGGATYLLRVMAPNNDDGSGEGSFRTVRTMKLRMPGSPTMEGLGNGHSMNEPPMVRSFSDPHVEVRRLDLEARREQELREERREMERRLAEVQRPPEAMIDHLKEASRVAVDAVRQNADQTTKMWTEETNRLRAQIADLTEKLNKEREESIRIRADSANIANAQETKMVTELRARLDHELAAQKDRYEQEHRSMKERHDSDLKNQKERYESEIRQNSERYAVEISRVKDDAANKIASITESAQKERDRFREDAKERLESAQKQFDQRLADVKESAKREIDSLTHRFESDILTVKENAKTRGDLSVQACTTEMSLLKAQIDRQAAEIDQLQRKNDELSARVFRPAMEQIVEAHDLAAKTGMVHPEEVKGAAGDEQQPWWKPAVEQAVPAIMGIAAKAFSGPPQQPQQRVIPRQPQQMPQQMMQRQLPPRQAAPRPQQIRRPAPPQPQVRMPISGEEPYTGPKTVLPLDGRPSAPAHTPVPAIVPPVVPSGQLPWPPGEPPQAAQPAAQPPAENQPQNEGGTNQDLEQLLALAEYSIESKTPPPQFVDQLFALAPPEVVAQALGQHNPDEVADWMSGHPSANLVATRDGRRFVAEAVSIIHQRLSQPPQPAAPEPAPEEPAASPNPQELVDEAETA